MGFVSGPFGGKIRGIFSERTGPTGGSDFGQYVGKKDAPYPCSL